MTEAKKVPSTKAIEDEAAGEKTFTVTWRDIKFDVPLDRDEWSFEAMLELENGRTMSAVRELVPDVQYAKFLARKPKTKDAVDIINQLMEGIGVQTAGESPASDD